MRFLVWVGTILGTVPKTRTLRDTENCVKFRRSRRLDGERGRNRTFNLLIKSQLLCQLSYAPIL